MFRNYVLVALRNLAKQKLFSGINIVGLVIGLTALILTNAIVNYEANYDSFFPNSDRIYAIAAVFQPARNIGVKFNPGVQPAFRPLIAGNLPGVEASARSFQEEHVARVGDRRFYQNMRFLDPEFLDIFTLDFIAGDPATALADPSGLILSESAVQKYFGSENPMGRTVTIDNRIDLRVTGIIRDLPPNTQFTASLTGTREFSFLANMKIYEDLTDQAVDENWGDLSGFNITFVMLRKGVSQESLNAGLEDIYENHAPDNVKDLLTNYMPIPLTHLNVSAWDTIGIPLPAAIRLVGFLILIVAIVNYTNLANAQFLGRVREIGLRKAMGAGRSQLFTQFVTESVTLALLALLVAIAISSAIIPKFNELSGRALSLGLTSPAVIGSLFALAVGTGLLGGFYPALRISRTAPVACLTDGSAGGSKSRLRSIIVALQFGVAIILASGGAVILAQNRFIERSSDYFARDRIVTLDRIDRPAVLAKYETLKAELLRLPGVQSVTASNNVPFEQSNSSSDFAHVHGDEASHVTMNMITHDPDFMSTYQIPLVAGRNLSRDVALDTLGKRVEEGGEYVQSSVNVVVNEIAARAMGWQDPAAAVGEAIYFADPEAPSLEFRIVGIIPDINYMGFQNKILPMMFFVRPENFQTVSIHIDGRDTPATLNQIEKVWDRVNPDFPIVMQFLDDQFNEIFNILRGIAAILGGFSLVALFVAAIGLFGLSAFVTEKRTKEIGIRKVMGASSAMLVRLMVWQISIPILIATLPAVLLAWFGIYKGYLELFPQRIDWILPHIGLSALAVLLLAWAVVSVNAWRIAQENPANTMRYE